MANGLAFPESEAQIIVAYARRTGETAAEELIERIRDWLGRPDVVMDRADSWDPKARRAILDAKQSIAACRDQLAPYWEGPAYDSFSTYIGDLERTFEHAQDIMGGMSELMRSARETVTATYQAAIQCIGDCAADILEAVGGLSGARANQFGALAEVAKLLAEFIRDVTATARRAMDLIADYTAVGMRLRTQATGLAVPGAMPPSAGAADGWTVREA